MIKPDSFEELSTQVKLTELTLVAVPAKLEGAFGGNGA
jgi:hypothetical protein